MISDEILQPFTFSDEEMVSEKYGDLPSYTQLVNERVGNQIQV